MGVVKLVYYIMSIFLLITLKVTNQLFPRGSNFLFPYTLINSPGPCPCHISEFCRRLAGNIFSQIVKLSAPPQYHQVFLSVFMMVRGRHLIAIVLLVCKLKERNINLTLKKTIDKNLNKSSMRHTSQRICQQYITKLEQ